MTSQAHIVIAPDSFKECLDAFSVAEALAAGWKRADPSARFLCRPMADGGENTLAALLQAMGGRLIQTHVIGPLGEPVRAAYGLSADGSTAIIEMAQAAGLHLAPPARRDPRVTTTRGVGELMLDALTHGIRKMIVAVGGSATNDGGAGMAQALGVSLTDAAGKELPPGGAALARLAGINTSSLCPRLENVEVLVACDVRNLLCGPQGASCVYAPQKGAGSDMAQRLDAALTHYADIVEQQVGKRLHDLEGGGAAGGLAAGLAAFAGARLCSGAALVADAWRLNEAADSADIIITGEGALDDQSAYGKVVACVAEIGKSHHVPVLAVAGQVACSVDTLIQMGITAAFSIVPGPMLKQDALGQTVAGLERTAWNIARIHSVRQRNRLCRRDR